MEKEIKITPPEGFEIDKKNSTFECIKFKPTQEKRWRDNKDAEIEGYYTNLTSDINFYIGTNRPSNYATFATEKQAKSALAMARISQIMANDERFGGVITDEEWCDCALLKYVITRNLNYIDTLRYFNCYYFLAFHTEGQRDLFLEENKDLVKDYLMID